MARLLALLAWALVAGGLMGAATVVWLVRREPESSARPEEPEDGLFV
jgi:hypothetical protein